MPNAQSWSALRRPSTATGNAPNTPRVIWARIIVRRIAFGTSAPTVEPQVVELWPCGYTAKCSAPACRRRATTILRYLDNQERPDGQTEACDTRASEALR